MGRYFDLLLLVLKWPAAAGAIVVLPGTLVAVFGVIGAILGKPVPIIAFTGGVLVYVLLWRLFLHRPVFGSFFSTLEHEFTHAVFAWLTFHWVTGIRATFRRGGHIQFRGRGNWLILVAPYFFPTLSVIVMLALAAVPVRHVRWLSVLLGASYAYHVISTWRETHAGQTDLQRVGFPFAVLFLPTANLLALGSVVAFAWGGGGAFGQFWARAFSLTGKYLRYVVGA